jgi:S1-C subfamily serine protease
VVAIGFPYHGLLTSDFTVTTGIVSSLSGLLKDTRFLQISAAVQPGNSGGPLLDTGGLIVGMVTAKNNSLTFVRATGNIPENINFAIKTRRDPRLPRQQRGALSNRGAQGRSQDDRGRRRRARLHALGLVHRDRAGREHG